MSEHINIDELEQVAAQAAGPQLGGANFTMAELKFRATFDPMTVLTLINQLRALGDRAMHLERRLSEANGEVLRLKGADQHALRLQAGHDEAVMRAQALEQERDALAARLAELEGQEPVAYIDNGTGRPHWYPGALPNNLPHGTKLFARPAPAEPVNARLLEALKACRNRFAEYVEHHKAKGDHHKAAANEAMVAMADVAIMSAPARQARSARLTVEDVTALLAASDKSSPKVPSFFIAQPFKFARAIETAVLRKNGLEVAE